MGTSTVPESELLVCSPVRCGSSRGNRFAFSYKLNDKQTLVIERRTSQRVTTMASCR